MNFSSIARFFDLAIEQPGTAIYTKFIALCLLYGATVHLGNILGFTGTPWLVTPLLWRSLDILLLIFNLVTAIALWRGFGWSILLLYGGIILFQILPYTLWRSHFILKPEDGEILNGLLGTEILLLSILSLLLWLKK